MATTIFLGTVGIITSSSVTVQADDVTPVTTTVVTDSNNGGNTAPNNDQSINSRGIINDNVIDTVIENSNNGNNDVTSDSNESKLDDIAVNKTVIDEYSKREQNAIWKDKTDGDSFDVKETIRHNVNYEVSVNPPEYEKNPLYSNTIHNKTDNETYTYSYDHGSAETSYYGLIEDINGTTNIYNFTNLSNQSYKISKQKGMDLVRNSFKAPYSTKNDIDVNETVFLTDNGIIVHHTTFTNNNNITIPETRYFVLLDTMLNYNDEINIYSDGLSGAYFKNNKLYFSTKLLSPGDMYSLNWHYRSSEIGYKLNSYKLSLGDIFIVDEDSAIRYTTDLVSLAPGKSIDLWYMEAILSNHEIQEIIKSGDAFDIGIEVKKFIEETVPEENVEYNKKQVKKVYENNKQNKADGFSQDIDRLEKDILSIQEKTDKFLDPVIKNTKFADDIKDNSAMTIVSSTVDDVKKATVVIYSPLKKVIGIFEGFSKGVEIVSDIHDKLDDIKWNVDTMIISAHNAIGNVGDTLSLAEPEVQASVVLKSKVKRTKSDSNKLVDQARDKVISKIDDESDELKESLTKKITSMGADILSTILMLIATFFVSFLGAVVLNAVLHPIFTMGAAALATLLVSILWTGKLTIPYYRSFKILPEKYTFGHFVNLAKRKVTDIAKTTKEGINSLLDKISK